MSAVGVLGAGAWGTAIANLLATNGHQVKIWCLEEEVVSSINTKKVNKLYLENVKLNKNISATNDLSDLATMDALFSVIPAQYTASVLSDLKAKAKIGSNVPFVICSKGIENQSKRLLSDIIKEVFPKNEIAIMSGPNFADEVALGKSAVTTIACANNKVAKKISALVSNNNFKTYVSNDIIGAQLGGSIKNVIAIALGIANGLKLSESSKAALLTQGLNEINQLSLALGGKSETAIQPCVIDDLVLTCSSLKSRNMSLGYELGQGKTLDEIIKSRNSVAEGVATTKAAFALAKSLSLTLPLISLIYDVLYEGKEVSSELFN